MNTYGEIECPCGNEPTQDGFDHCLPDGTLTDPVADGPWEGHYRCARCGKVWQIPETICTDCRDRGDCLDRFKVEAREPGADCSGFELSDEARQRRRLERLEAQAAANLKTVARAEGLLNENLKLRMTLRRIRDVAAAALDAGEGS